MDKNGPWRSEKGVLEGNTTRYSCNEDGFAGLEDVKGLFNHPLREA